MPYEGNYSAYLDKKRKRLEQEAKQDAARQRELNSELEWIRQGARGRQAKQKARIKAYEELLSQHREQAPGSAQILIPTPERLGDIVIKAESVSKGYGDLLLIEDLSFNPAARRHRRRHRPERCRQDDPVPDDHGPGATRFRHLPGR